VAGMAGSAEEPYELTTEELAPFSMQENGMVTGLSTDILKAAFARAKLPMETRLYPWLRAYQSALEKPNGCVYSTTRTAEREAQFKWVGPIVHDDWVIFVLADSTIKINSLKDLKRYKTASTPGDALADYLAKNGIDVGFTPTDGQIQMLTSRRIDFWGTTLARGIYIAREHGVKLKPVLTLRKVDMYLACNRQMPDAVISSLNQAVHALEEEGAIEKLAALYR
jgi:polar amino acid transport system substrate-binding protein